jgi:hypothetical protein
MAMVIVAMNVDCCNVHHLAHGQPVISCINNAVDLELTFAFFKENSAAAVDCSNRLSQASTMYGPITS